MTDGAPARGARFAPGDLVRTAAADPAGHTRLPRYARGHTGRVVEAGGSWPLADDLAERSGEPRVEQVYTVAFAARDLWGEQAGAGDEVTVDLWESYLERAEQPEPAQPGEDQA